MFKRIRLLNVILNLFEGGAGGAGGDAAGATAAGDGTQAAQGGAKLPGNTRQGKSGDLSKVVYGKQPEGQQTPAAGEKKEEQKAPTREERRKAWEARITGEDKEFYTEDTQRMINRRFKETKQLQEQVDGYKPILDRLRQRFGTDDPGKLAEAMDNDDLYIESKAEELGLDHDRTKEYLQMQRENAAHHAAEEAQRRADQAVKAQTDKWMRQAYELSQANPGFNMQQEVANPRFMDYLQDGIPVSAAYDLCHPETIQQTLPGFIPEAEMANPGFRRLLAANIPVADAYKCMHLQEITDNAANTAAQARERQVAAAVRANGMRPAENGASSQSAFTTRDDVSKLTKADRREIAKRVARGERIEF